MGKDEIIKRLLEIQTELREGKEGIDIDALETEMRDLQGQLKEIERRENLIKEIETSNLETVVPEQRTAEKINSSEKRGKDLKEGRAVQISSGTLVVQTHVDSDVRPVFTEISSLVDLVNVVDLPGGEAHQVPYQKPTAEGGYTNEKGQYVEADIDTGYAEIGKTKLTAYSEITEEAEKLPAAKYDEMATNGIRTSIRKKLAKEIMVGDGTAGHLTGIFSSEAKAISATTDLQISSITGDTLDDIVYSYGGEEAVEGGRAYLILNKKDLRAFAKLKSTDGKKLHKISLQGSTGTIDEVPFVINSACPALSESGTAVGTYCMAYGYLSNYNLSTFSPIDLQKSYDYKFKEGMIANKGSLMIGGNVVAYNGFIRVKKVASV
jgi:HK97 family phage major capsid protein